MPYRTISLLVFEDYHLPEQEYQEAARAVHQEGHVKPEEPGSLQVRCFLPAKNIIKACNPIQDINKREEAGPGFVGVQHFVRLLSLLPAMDMLLQDIQWHATIPEHFVMKTRDIKALSHFFGTLFPQCGNG